MTSARKHQIRTLLKGIETGDPESVAVVNEAKYIQHNPMTREGSEGLAELFKRLSQTSPRVGIVRMLEDGDYVVAHTEYDFDDVVVGFEVFRFEDGLAVEHWDNLQREHGAPNASGHTMNDGPTEVTDLDKTQPNRELVRSFVDDILIGRRLDKLDDYVGDAEGYTEHNPQLSDGVQALRSALSEVASNGEPVIVYSRMHRLIAEGNFQLCVCEGFRDGVHTAFYDLFRVHDLKVVEHWDTTDAIPPRSEWRNDNGKF
ncbi:MAG: nuclear transport factor 2 family protein [Acidimicrobiia bacterium]|nr:nuclear transport factor 2 family protein [Acidimicrobiia bacterium]